MKHQLPEHPVYRAGTVDRAIWAEAVEANPYGLPDLFQHGDHVLNLGAHTGSVAWRCAVGGAHVVCIEPSRENYHLLCHNLRPVWDRVLPIHAAAWRSDIGATTLRFEPNWQPCNTGGGGVMGDKGGAGYDVLALPLDDVLRWREEWRLLVTDCEGAEFACLYTSRELGRVRQIVGEYHERHESRPHADVGKPCRMDALCEHLAGLGFTVDVEPKGTGMGLFRAARLTADNLSGRIRV